VLPNINTKHPLSMTKNRKDLSDAYIQSLQRNSSYAGRHERRKNPQQARSITKFTTCLITATKILAAKLQSPREHLHQQKSQARAKHYSKFGSNPPITNTNQVETPEYHWTGPLFLIPFLVQMGLMKVKHVLPPASGHIQISSRC